MSQVAWRPGTTKPSIITKQTSNVNVLKETRKELESNLKRKALLAREVEESSSDDDYFDDDSLDDVSDDEYLANMTESTPVDESFNLFKTANTPRTHSHVGPSTRYTSSGDSEDYKFKFDLTNHIMKTSVHGKVNDSIKHTLRHHFRKARDKKIKHLRNTIHLRNKVHDFEKMPHEKKSGKYEKKSATEVALNWGDLADTKANQNVNDVVQQRLQTVSEAVRNSQPTTPTQNHAPVIQPTIKDTLSEGQSLVVTAYVPCLEEEEEDRSISGVQQPIQNQSFQKLQIPPPIPAMFEKSETPTKKGPTRNYKFINNNRILMEHDSPLRPRSAPLRNQNTIQIEFRDGLGSTNYIDFKQMDAAYDPNDPKPFQVPHSKLSSDLEMYKKTKGIEITIPENIDERETAVTQSLRSPKRPRSAAPASAIHVEAGVQLDYHYVQPRSLASAIEGTAPIYVTNHVTKSFKFIPDFDQTRLYNVSTSSIEQKRVGSSNKIHDGFYNILDEDPPAKNFFELRNRLKQQTSFPSMVGLPRMKLDKVPESAVIAHRIKSWTNATDGKVTKGIKLDVKAIKARTNYRSLKIKHNPTNTSPTSSPTKEQAPALQISAISDTSPQLAPPRTTHAIPKLNLVNKLG